MTKSGILGSGKAGTALAVGYSNLGHEVMIGTRTVSKLDEWQKENPNVTVGTFAEVAVFAETIFLATVGWAAIECLESCGNPADVLDGKVIIDATNPLKKDLVIPPPNGYLEFYKPEGYNSQMESLQGKFPNVKFVKGFTNVGSHFFFNHPGVNGVKPCIFICGNDNEAKKYVTELIESAGHDVEDFGPAAVAGCIEASCQMWGARAFNSNKWNHAFAMLKV